MADGEDPPRLAIAKTGARVSTHQALKFVDPDTTVDGKVRASVPLVALRTLWFNTGTLCNLTCQRCYIESSPRNDRLAYLTVADVAGYLDDRDAALLTHEIGFTGGGPSSTPASSLRR
jgi:hypothetical protein